VIGRFEFSPMTGGHAAGVIKRKSGVGDRGMTMADGRAG
jgi:hypothetical protein